MNLIYGVHPIDWFALAVVLALTYWLAGKAAVADAMRQRKTRRTK